MQGKSAGHSPTMTTDTGPAATPLADVLNTALRQDDVATLDELAEASPSDARDRFATLLAIYALHSAPLETLGTAARHQHHPAVAAMKQRCEQAWLAEL